MDTTKGQSRWLLGGAELMWAGGCQPLQQGDLRDSLSCPTLGPDSCKATVAYGTSHPLSRGITEREAIAPSPPAPAQTSQGKGVAQTCKDQLYLRAQDTSRWLVITD